MKVGSNAVGVRRSVTTPFWRLVGYYGLSGRAVRDAKRESRKHGDGCKMTMMITSNGFSMEGYTDIQADIMANIYYESMPK